MASRVVGSLQEYLLSFLVSEGQYVDFPAWRAKADVHDALREQATFGCQTDFMTHCWQREE